MEAKATSSVNILIKLIKGVSCYLINLQSFLEPIRCLVDLSSVSGHATKSKITYRYKQRKQYNFNKSINLWPWWSLYCIKAGQPKTHFFRLTIIILMTRNRFMLFSFFGILVQHTCTISFVHDSLNSLHLSAYHCTVGRNWLLLTGLLYLQST